MKYFKPAHLLTVKGKESLGKLWDWSYDCESPLTLASWQGRFSRSGYSFIDSKPWARLRSDVRFCLDQLTEVLPGESKMSQGQEVVEGDTQTWGGLPRKGAKGCLTTIPGRQEKQAAVGWRLWLTCGAGPPPLLPGSWTNRLGVISTVAAAARQWPVALRGGTAWDSPAGCRSAALRTHTLETPWPAWTPAKQTLVVSAACSVWEPYLGD